MMLSEGQMNDQKGATILAPPLPPAREPIADRGTAACIPPKRNRKQPIPCDKTLHRQRHRIEIMFGRHSAGSRTGAASPPATTDAPPPSSAPSRLPPSSPSGSGDES